MLADWILLHEIYLKQGKHEILQRAFWTMHWHHEQSHTIVWRYILQYDNTLFSFMLSQIVLYFLHSTSVLSYYIDAVLTLSIDVQNNYNWNINYVLIEDIGLEPLL